MVEGRRKISVFGDSISTFEGAVPCENRIYYDARDSQNTGVASIGDTWWMQVIDALGGEFFTNASFSGSTVQGWGFPAASSAERAAQVDGANGDSPDDILVFIGINDYGWGNVCAQVAARSEAASLAVDDVTLFEGGMFEGGPIPATDEDVMGFQKAYSEMLANLHKVAPCARIWCISLIPGRLQGRKQSSFCYQLRGRAFEDYNRAIAAAAQGAGCAYVDIAGLGFDYESIDGTHPTKQGMSQLASLVASAILQRDGIQEGNAFKPGDLFPEYMRSENACERPSCMGCEHAESTGNKWSCVCNLHSQVPV